MADNSSFNYSVGLHNVGSYRVSGDPWVSGSDSQAANEEVRYQFPWVAKRVTIYNYSARVLRVHFNATGSEGDVIGGIGSADSYGGQHYLEVQPVSGSQAVLDLNCKCSEIYVSIPDDSGGAGHYRVFAELTGIPVGRMYDLTGSGLTEAPAGSDE
jgi:hypothetical protein